MDNLDIIANVYFLISCIACFIVGIVALAYDVIDEDIVLSDIKEFIRCVFIFQVFAYEALKGTINKVGIVIVEILLTDFMFAWNIILFVLLFFVKVIVFISHVFWLIFRIREDDGNV